MKELLYLKDDQIKEFIQLLYYAYRETFSDPREILSRKFFGPAHLRALHLIERLGLQKKRLRSVLLIARGTGGAGNVSCRGQRSLHASIPCEKRNSAAVKGFALSGSFAFSARHKASRVQPHC